MALRNSYVSVKVDCRTTPSAALARISLFVVSALLVGACAAVPSDQARGATVAAGQSGTRAVSGTTGSEFTSQPSPATTEMTSHPLATTTQPAPNTVPRASTSSTGSVSQSVGTGRVLRVTGRHLFTFTSPSGNIVCLMQESETQSNDASVRCSIESKTWKPPPRPSSCGLDWGSDLELDHGGGRRLPLLWRHDPTSNAGRRAIRRPWLRRLGRDGVHLVRKPDRRDEVLEPPHPAWVLHQPESLFALLSRTTG